MLEQKFDLQNFLTSEKIAELDAWITKFPEEQRQSAVLEALHIVQAEHAWLTEPMLQAVADYLRMPLIAVYEVATFYSMYNLKLTGKHRIDVCTNLSCMLNRSKDIVRSFEERLGIQMGETTEDGQFTLRAVECLGACVNAPVCQIGRTTYEGLTPEAVHKIIDDLG